MKLPQQFLLKPDTQRPWLYQARYPYNPALNKSIKKFPGVTWNPAAKKWMVPVELAHRVGEVARKYGLKVPVHTVAPRDIKVPDVGLHDYQVKGVRKAVENKRWIFNDSMGLGKTAQAIVSARMLGAKKILIVCPAVVRSAWVSEIGKWFGDPAAYVGVIMASHSNKSLSKKAKKALIEAYYSDIQIVSYNLVQHVKVEPWDCIIFDEIHRMASPTTAWSVTCRNIVTSNPSAAVFGLTATLMPDQPVQCWNPIDTIWPGRFGEMQKNNNGCWAFKNRYTNSCHNGYGWTFKGANEAHVDELRERLSHITSRTTKQDVAHLLPPFDVRLIKVPASKSYVDIREVKDLRAHKDMLETALLSASAEKIPHVLDWLEDAVTDASHVCILTHLKATACELRLQIEKKYTDRPVYIITGDLSPEMRNEALAEAKRLSRAVVVCTMHSVGIGIDLTFCTQALFAELYYRPETVIQATGRFSRLSGVLPSAVAYLVLEGTMDEIVGDRLLEKIATINQLIDADDTENRMQDVLGTVESEDEFLLGLNAAADSYIEDGYSL